MSHATPADLTAKLSVVQFGRYPVRVSDARSVWLSVGGVCVVIPDKGLMTVQFGDTAYWD